MEYHRCIICLGSNTNRKNNILVATERLRKAFPDISFSSMIESKPIGTHSKKCFLNRVAIFRTHWNPTEVKEFFTSIEQEAGRRPEDKNKEIIILGIDLVVYDKKIYKPQDITCDYLLTGIRELDLTL
ncbi:MAG: 2-amino-4-hydroxy-6-hydroxymethyldihydropteridine diphosphokinase [Bacteroides sp.]|nr:2-amino-4-hydroxy-6-hydroxymethyldihydropteridine diphosphokinase [Bacteroides sp.]